MGEPQKRGLGIGALVGIGSIVGMLCGGFVAARAMGEATGQLAATVASHAQRIEELGKAAHEDRQFRERVLAHMAAQDERWAQIQRVIYRGTPPNDR
jgi:hypothetical protein